ACPSSAALSRRVGATSGASSGRASAGSGPGIPWERSSRPGETQASSLFRDGASVWAGGSSSGERVALETSRPAFYALRSGGWRDYVTLLHPPYPAWHVSSVAIGAALSAEFSWSRLLPTLAAFFLAVGIGAHALDELNGRPLQTEIPQGVRVLLAAFSIGGAVAIGIVGAVGFDPWIAAFVAAGAFIVVAYKPEYFGGRFHGAALFCLR